MPAPAPRSPSIATCLALDRRADLRADGLALSELLAAPETRRLIVAGGRPAIVSDDQRTQAHIRWFTREACEAILRDAGGESASQTLFLGLDAASGSACFAVSLSDAAAAAIEPRLKPLVDLRSLASQGVMCAEDLSLLALAKSLAEWHTTHRYCGRCGAASVAADGGWKRRCPACDLETFPRIDPVVIMAVTDGRRLLLVRQAQFPDGMYSLPAGFVEPGEDIEHAVRRESREETGLAVRDVTYVLSQPWPYPHSLMIGCLAAADAVAVVAEPAEIADARWFERDEIAAMLAGRHTGGLWLPGRQAIAHSLIQHWLEMASGPP